MSEMNESLADALLEKLTHHAEHAPVYELRQPSVTELVERAHQWGGRVLGTPIDRDAPRIDLCHRTDSTVIRLPEGGTVKIYHASGAMMIARRLEPVSHTFGSQVDHERVIERATEVIEGLDIPTRPVSGERIEVERLWQINAQGMTQRGDVGKPVVCRVVSAFRRYVDDFPVWGRASVFVKLAANDLVESVGVDWRERITEAVDHVRLIEPNDAVRCVLAELAVNTPGHLPEIDEYEPELFAVGYFSLPKRRPQGFLQPVYVAALRARGDTTMSRLVVVPGAVAAYESLSRIAAAPPHEAART
ncbi:hypothetical protein [Nonomuraea roseola]|uniref:Uncharacterized protein n=1 Tax=Nonomuraea roseola TaxID=46179 RepID=A0ABV5QFE6_9ACTN